MADFLDTAFNIAYTRETPAESYKLMNIRQKVMSTAYESGERVLTAGSTDVKLVDNVTNFYLIASKPISIFLGDGTSFSQMDQFAYSGKNPISVSVTNPDNIAIKVTYAAGVQAKS